MAELLTAKQNQWVMGQIKQGVPDDAIIGAMKEIGEDPALVSSVINFYKTKGQSAQPREKNWSDVAIEAATNIPKSAYNTGASIVSAVAHPVRTAMAIGNTALGVGEKLIPGGTYPHEKYADAVLQSMFERYGGINELKNTLSSDPIGAALDAATVAGGVGAAAQAANMPKLAKVATTVADYANPVVLAGKAAQAATPNALVNRLYEAAVKPAKSVTKGDPVRRSNMLAQGIKLEIVPSESGYFDAVAKKAAIDEAVDSIIKQTGGDVSLKAITDKIGADMKATLANSPSKTADIAKVEDYLKSLIMEHGETIPAVNARGMQKIIHERNAAKYNTPAYGEIDTILDKTLGAELGKQLKTLAPEITPLQLESGAMKDLIRAIKDRIVTSGNFAVPRLIPAALGGAALAGGQSGMSALATAAVMQALMDPRIQSRISFYAKKAKNATAPSSVKRGTEYLYQSGNIPEVEP